MLELRRWYRERLTTRIVALEAARRRLANEPQESRDSIRRIAHSLRGSGATYGFPQITESARSVEEGADGELEPRIDTLLEILKEVASGGRSERAGILVVEDDPEQAHFLEVMLAGPDRDIVIAESVAQAQAIVQDRVISLVLLDLILPDGDGRNFLLRLRERPATAGIPVIVVTVKGADQAKAECLALGAEDYVEKPVNADALQAAVRAKLGIGPEATLAARRDPLTGLPNRAAFHEAFLQARFLSGTPGDPLSIGIVDLDNFKSVNDTYGHPMGDQVLRRVASVMSRTLRNSDFLARWGGEEFTALFPRTDVAGATIALEKMLRSLREESFPTGDGRAVRVTFSAGVVQVPKEASAEDAVSLADRYLYRAKSMGRNRVVSPADTTPPPRARIMIVEDDELIATLLRHCLTHEGFEVLHYSNGLDALAAAADSGTSLIISDVRMPKMDGFEMLKQLRGMPGLAQVPIIMLTSMGSEEDLTKGFQLGADDYVLKPFSTAELLSRVRRLLKRH